MSFLERLYLFDVLHSVAQNLIIPTIFLLFLFLIFAIYSIGSIIIEALTEHTHYKVRLPDLVADIDAAPYKELPAVIQGSGLLLSQRLRLFKLVRFMYLPEDARTEVATRLLYDQTMAYNKVVGRSETMSKIAPMFGLMGTLIPLGPGIVALGAGDTATLSQSLLIAFDTTIAGIVVAAICFVISRIRKRWYGDYLVSLEAVFNTLLEKARLLQEQGFVFPRLEDKDFPGYQRAKAAKAIKAEKATKAARHERSAEPPRVVRHSAAPDEHALKDEQAEKAVQGSHL